MLSMPSAWGSRSTQHPISPLTAPRRSMLSVGRVPSLRNFVQSNLPTQVQVFPMADPIIEPRVHGGSGSHRRRVELGGRTTLAKLFPSTVPRMVLVAPHHCTAGGKARPASQLRNICTWRMAHARVRSGTCAWSVRCVTAPFFGVCLVS